jgi:putative ABC transport system permease protein
VSAQDQLLSLALSTLIYEWRRYLAAVIALAFSGLLILAEVGMFVGIGKSFTATIDRSPADIIIMAPKSESLINDGGGNGVPRRLMPLIFMHPEVLRINDLSGGGGMYRNLNNGSGAKTKQTYVQIMSVDLEPGAVTWPNDYTEQDRLALSEPFSIAADETTLPRLGIKLGDKAILAGHLVKLTVVLHNYANVNQPMIIVSRDTLRLLGQAPPSDRMGPLMVKIRHPEQALLVRDQLNRMGAGQFRAWTRKELADANDKALMKEQIIGVMMNFTIALGFFIGVGITWQTLRGAILANIKEFASLRALGVSMGSLRQIVLELSFWVGIVGLLATGVFVWGVALLGKSGGVPLVFPPEYIAMAVVLLMVIAIGSGFLSLGILKKSQPADLLR